MKQKYGLLWPALWRGHLGCRERRSRTGNLAGVQGTYCVLDSGCSQRAVRRSQIEDTLGGRAHGMIFRLDIGVKTGSGAGSSD